MGSVDLLRAVFERFAAHQGLDGLHTDDLRIIGDPPVGSFNPREGATTTERMRNLHDQGVSFHLRDVEDVGPDTAIFSAVWSHSEGTRSGSAGLYWGAVRVRDHKIARLTYCASHEDAVRALGVTGS